AVLLVIVHLFLVDRFTLHPRSARGRQVANRSNMASTLNSRSTRYSGCKINHSAQIVSNRHCEVYHTGGLAEDSITPLMVSILSASASMASMFLESVSIIFAMLLLKLLIASF